MKKLTICLLIFVLLLAGCSAPQQQDPLEVAKPIKTTSETESGDKTVQYGKDTYGDTIQVNQKKINWATYDDQPVDIELIGQEIFTELETVLTVPAWTKYNYQDSFLYNSGPDYLVVTARSSDEHILEDTITNTTEWKDLVDFEAKQTDTIEINGYSVKVNIGGCVVNNRAANPKEFVSFVVTKECEAYCFLAITEDGAAHTTDFFVTMLKEMTMSLSSIYQENFGEEAVEANQEG